jgi:hypothetical protein
MKQTKKDGTLSWKIQICESVRVGKKVTRKVVRHVGMAHRQEELERFQRLAAALLESELAHKQNSALLFDASDDVESQFEVTPRHFMSEDLIEESRTIERPQEIYGSLFDELGLVTILAGPHSEVLKNVVLALATEPASKRKTQETLERDLGFTVSLDRIYRMMTALADKQDEITKVIFSQAASLFDNKIDVVFFDVTTLYFESIQSDELRAFGYITAKIRNFILFKLSSHWQQQARAYLSATNFFPEILQKQKLLFLAWMNGESILMLGTLYLWPIGACSTVQISLNFKIQDTNLL